MTLHCGLSQDLLGGVDIPSLNSVRWAPRSGGTVERVKESRFKIAKISCFSFLLHEDFQVWYVLPCCTRAGGITGDKESGSRNPNYSVYGSNPISLPDFSVFSAWFDTGGLSFVFKHNSVHGLATEGQRPSGFQICLFQLDLGPSTHVCLQILLPNRSWERERGPCVLLRVGSCSWIMERLGVRGSGERITC